MKAFCDNPPGFILLCSCFLTMSLNRTKLKYGTMKLKAYEKIIWMIEFNWRNICTWTKSFYFTAP